MRILHVISSLDPRDGGPPVALAGLAAAQQRAGLHVAVASTFTNDAPAAAAQSLGHAGVNVQLIGPAHGSLSRHPQIRPVLRGAIANADIVHIHALWEEIQHQAARLAHARGVPYLIRPCGMLDPWSLSQSRLKKRLYLALRLRRNLNRAAALHFTSDTERDLTASLHLSAPAIVEPNGLDLGEFESLPAPGTFRGKYPQLQNRPMILFLSRLHPKKGLDLLIPAFARLGQIDAMLVIAGPDSDGYQARVQAAVIASGLESRVIFAGMLHGRERVAALADADLFVLPSYQENFGIVVAESLAAGTPVVISDQVNIHREILAAQVGGVTPLDMVALADELRRWISDPLLRRQAADRARPFVWQKYDWRKIAQNWVVWYEKLAAKAGTPRP